LNAAKRRSLLPTAGRRLRPLTYLRRAPASTREHLAAEARRVVSSHPATPRPLDRLEVLRLALRSARGGRRGALALALAVPGWLAYSALSPEANVADPLGILLVGTAGALWLLGLALLPLAAYRRLRPILEHGRLAAAVVIEAAPAGPEALPGTIGTRRVEDPHGTFTDEFHAPAGTAESAVRPGARTRVLLDPAAPRVVMELGRG
jgi:hypothetical protein